MFGADMTLLSRLFPSRSRRQIKNRYKKEEKENSDRVMWALKNRIPIDFEWFSKFNEETIKAKGERERE